MTAVVRMISPTARGSDAGTRPPSITLGFRVRAVNTVYLAVFVVLLVVRLFVVLDAQKCTRQVGPIIARFGFKQLLVGGLGGELPLSRLGGFREGEILPSGRLGDRFVVLGGADKDVPFGIKLLGDVFET